MPQLDLTSVCGGSTDRKITCETLAAGANETDSITSDPQSASQIQNPDPDPQPDYAPASFWLSEDAELDWLDRNAVIERKESGKGGAAPTAPSQSGHLNPGSHRYATNLKSSASIIGLPKRQNNKHAESGLRRPTRSSSIWVLPKPSESMGGKSAASEIEPLSPKVSCIGRVRSKKDRSQTRAARNHRRKEPEPSGTGSRNVQENRTSFWRCFGSVGRKQQEEKNIAEEPPKLERVGSVKTRGFSPAEEAEPPRLGAVQRFSSGRKSSDWAAGVKINGVTM